MASQAATVSAIVGRLIHGASLGLEPRKRRLLASLTKVLASAYKINIPDYNVGLEATDAYSRSKFGSLFVALSTSQQDAVLSDMGKRYCNWLCT